VRAWAQHLPADCAVDLVIAVNELITNAVKHGPDFGRVRLLITRQTDSLLFIEVADEGLPQAVATRPPDATSGRGLHMVDTIATDWGVSYHPTRTWFTMRVALPADRVVTP